MAIICGLWSKIRIIHICLSTSKETTSRKLSVLDNPWIMAIIHGLLKPSRSLKTHVFLGEMKDHLPRKVMCI